MGILRKIFGKDTTTDVLEILTAQHREVDELLEMLLKGEGDRQALFTELANNLAAHATVEEKVFYPAIMAKETKDMLNESLEEHLAIRRLLSDLITMKLDDEGYKAKLHVLKEQVDHHAHNEEEDELFPKVKDMFSSDERAAIGNELLVMFTELMQTNPYQNVPSETAAAAELEPPAPAR
jgi:hemerythrin superfamily protein